jgi:Zn-finger nucleic acid-binding protein
VIVDECYACDGFFLDSGELREIRENYMSKEDKDAFIQKLVVNTPLRENSEKIKIRDAAFKSLGRLLSRWYPFIWP